MSIRKSLRVVATLLRIFSKIPEAASASATLKIITATDKKAIKEIFKLYEYVSDIYFGFFINNELNVSKFKRLLKIDLTNFKEISEICHIYSKNDNLSKLITRMNTLKKKTSKVLNGIISFSSFVNDEIVPQKNFLDVFSERLKLFNEDQFCIFLLCYDIKKTNHNIF